ncbi:MAG: hypothetical protein ACLUD2_16415 [Clostridium sp.]
MVKENATVTICHTRTKDLAGTCRNAEIVHGCSRTGKNAEWRLCRARTRW